jgi:hypothetical protein
MLDIIIESDEHLLRELLHELRKIRHLLTTVTSFRITQVAQESKMAITGIIPGTTGVFKVTQLNAAGAPVQLPLPVVDGVPIWKSSDPLAVPTVSTDGLSAAVAVDTAAPQTGSFTLSVAMPDGSAPSSATVPYDQKPADNKVASFAFDQIS